MMSDVMLLGVLRMPYDLAMSDDLSRIQFHGRAQQAADRIEADDAAIAQLQQQVAALEKLNANLTETTLMVIKHNTAKTKEIARLEADRESLVRKALVVAKVCETHMFGSPVAAQAILKIDPSTITNEVSK
jgi:hypothetical protein